MWLHLNEEHFCFCSSGSVITHLMGIQMWQKLSGSWKFNDFQIWYWNNFLPCSLKMPAFLCWRINTCCGSGSVRIWRIRIQINNLDLDPNLQFGSGSDLWFSQKINILKKLKKKVANIIDAEILILSVNIFKYSFHFH